MKRWYEKRLKKSKVKQVDMCVQNIRATKVEVTQEQQHVKVRRLVYLHIHGLPHLTEVTIILK